MQRHFHIVKYLGSCNIFENDLFDSDEEKMFVLKPPILCFYLLFAQTHTFYYPKVMMTCIPAIFDQKNGHNILFYRMIFYFIPGMSIFHQKLMKMYNADPFKMWHF